MFALFTNYRVLNIVHRILLPVVLLSLVFFFAAGCSGQAQETKLRVGLIPNQSPDKVKAQYEPFRKYLSEKLNMPVELFVAVDYTAVVEAMASGKLDVAYFGGLTYVQAKQRAEIYPSVTEIDRYSHTTKYHSLIIAPANSPVETVADLKGKTFAFGDINSTSGSLYPRIMLDRAGIKVPEDLKQVIYTGGHDATALAVQNQTVDAGGVEDRIFYTLVEQGVIDPDKVKIIARSDPIEGYPWVVRVGLDKDLVERITQAFLDMDDPELLKLMRAEGYARVSDADYLYIEEEAQRLGLLRK
ncbi:phosphate/phosphite/phosphonate ABC transporter substrate-binding protein [Calderihabitans maritimus]|uniref:Phosphonate ABC transporter periplasmic phosphonate-binding protein n=1 Tax=Calderihabitans maritimus TaxID=1246530 RepID=A0A1Z5HNN8_9FIRM|nr:phosphate/phosphite/phosphonate ABC transporter substrate-binding protein [Calderihabitans maritimus]GAW90997.1 phosphonate ABC transporter periplasmic phosphonate-binding protein [Calderihabitans maritimus]